MIQPGNTRLNDGKWHFAAGTYDGSKQSLYVDGKLVASAAATGQVSGYAITLGLTPGRPSTGAYSGLLDESRISTVARSADWISTEFSNQSSPSTFYTIFAENGPSISVTPSGLALYASQTQQFTGAVLGACSNPPITWSSSPAGVGTISASGLYTAPAAISTPQAITITAMSQAGTSFTGSATLTLLPPASVAIAPSAGIILYGGGVQQFTASVSNAINTGVTWSVNPAGAGSIDSTGLYTAPAVIPTLQNVTVAATSVADPTKSTTVSIVLAPGQSVSSGFGSVFNVIAQAECRRPHAAPVVSAGPDQYIALSCPTGGGPCSGTTTVTATPTSYSLAPGASLTYGWGMQSGPGAVQFGTAAAASTQVTFGVAGTYTLQVSVNDGIATSLATTHVIVSPAVDSACPITRAPNCVISLYLTPTAGGPNATGTTAAFQIKMLQYVNGGIGNITGNTVTISVSGANAQTTTVVTDSNGSAPFTYIGQNAGSDTITATSGTYVSNSVPVSWIATTPKLTSSPITAKFFSADGSGVFNMPASQQPAFVETFPSVNFNPAAGTGSSVSNLTRPFTDALTDATGAFAGTAVAQAGQFQAGTGTLYNFAAVLTGTLTVPAAGQVTFAFSSDDAFIFGVGNGAARVSGSQTAVPAATPFQSYPVMGGVNQRSALAANAITVNFPAAGNYPYEVDYAKGGDKNLTLTMLASGAPIPPSTVLVLTPTVVSSLPAGQVQSVQLAATDANGVALAGKAVTFNVTGSNPQSVSLTTDGTGKTSFAYAGSPLQIGADQVQATATVNGAAAYSNIVTVPWNSGVNQAPVVSAGSAQTITLPAPAILNGSASDDGLPNNTLTITWSMQSGPGAVTFDNPNQAVTAAYFSTAGSYTLLLTASDGALTSTSTATITVNAPAGQTNNWIAAPLDGSTVTAPTPVTLISGVTLTSGTLTLYPAASPQTPTPVTVLNSATTGAGQIRVLDPTTLSNGTYFLELKATNSQGVLQDNLAMIHIAGDYKPGRVAASVTDLTVPAPGIAIPIQRNYDSLTRASSGDFGFGWNLGVNIQIEVNTVADVTLTLGGRRRTFYFTPTANSVFTYYYTPLYTAEPGLHGSLITTGDNCSGLVVHMGNIWQCAINNAGILYQPTGYQYTDPGGRVYTIGATGALQSVRDLNGNTLTVTVNGILSSAGINVPFVRDAAGRITQITDPLGNKYVYAYDTAGNLSSVTY